MAILAGKHTRLLVQGMGKMGQFHAKLSIEYGTAVVAGVHPGKGGTTIDDIPVFETVEEAVREKPCEGCSEEPPRPHGEPTRDACARAVRLDIDPLLDPRHHVRRRGRELHLDREVWPRLERQHDLVMHAPVRVGHANARARADRGSVRQLGFDDSRKGTEPSEGRPRLQIDHVRERETRPGRHVDARLERSHAAVYRIPTYSWPGLESR